MMDYRLPTLFGRALFVNGSPSFKPKQASYPVTLRLANRLEFLAAIFNFQQSVLESSAPTG
jgi:hypothetical protein